MRNLNDWLTAYGESHRNPINILIHKICVPSIMFSVLGLLWTVPVPGLFEVRLLNWATLTIVFCLIFYASLSLTLALGMLLQSVLMCFVLHLMANVYLLSVWKIALAIFVIAWIFQFIGHKIEGKKPSFFQDLVFLLIGPLWTTSFLYRRLGIPLS